MPGSCLCPSRASAPPPRRARRPRPATSPSSPRISSPRPERHRRCGSRRPGARPAAPAPRGPRLTLYGTTVGPQGAVALIDADPKVPGAEIYRLGDVVAGAALVAITDSTVTLAEPSGPLVLHLRPAQRRKP